MPNNFLIFWPNTTITDRKLCLSHIWLDDFFFWSGWGDSKCDFLLGAGKKKSTIYILIQLCSQKKIKIILWELSCFPNHLSKAVHSHQRIYGLGAREQPTDCLTKPSGTQFYRHVIHCAWHEQDFTCVFPSHHCSYHRPAAGTRGNHRFRSAARSMATTRLLKEDRSDRYGGDTSSGNQNTCSVSVSLSRWRHCVCVCVFDRVSLPSVEENKWAWQSEPKGLWRVSSVNASPLSQFLSLLSPFC